MSHVVVYLGPARSGKTTALVRLYRQALGQRAGNPLREHALWLAPNARTAAAVRRELLADGLRACLVPGVMTFGQLCRKILDDSPRWRPVDRLLQRELLRQVVESALASGDLTFFADAAQRSGFLDLVTEHIDELQRRDIRPAAYAKARSPRVDRQQHRELALLYDAYAALLKTHRLLDRETTHLAACDALATGAGRHYADLQMVVADGFTDFTHTQHDILRLLAARAKQLLISLPIDVDVALPARDDLFAKTADTLRALERTHGELHIERCDTQPAACPALDYLASHVFRAPAEIPPLPTDVLDSLQRLEIIEAAGAQDEIIAIARRIKRMLTGKGTGPFLSQEPEAAPAPPKMDLSPFLSRPVRPTDILVIFRSLSEAAPRVREVFDQFGIPYCLETAPPLFSAPIVKTFLSLLRLDLEDWPFRRVVSLLTNNTLAALDPAARQAADWLVRDLQIAQGRKKLLERVADLAADESLKYREHAARRTARATAALPALTALKDALDALPDRATPTEWAAALADAAGTLGCAPLADHSDLAAWQLIVDHFAALEQLDAALGQPSRTWSRADLASALADVASNQKLPQPDDEVGHVRVLSAPAARTLRARHVFLAGMSEQAFPTPERAGQLATDGDYHHATRIAHKIADEGRAATRAHDEMLLFYEVLSRARETLTISYPALDDKAQVLPPSPYVLEIERLLGDQGGKRIRRTRPQLTPVPQDAAACSPAEWRVQAIAHALDDDRRLLAGLFADTNRQRLARAVDAGVRIVHARARRDSFGPAEGFIHSPRVATRLARRFGPQHLWSPSQWENYASCPYRFFMEDVLGLEPLGDLELEIDFARRGSRLHDVLAAFYRQWLELNQNGGVPAEERAAQFREGLCNVIDGRVAAAAHAGIDAALMELDRRQIRRWADKHFDHHELYGSLWSKHNCAMTPSHFEFRFGSAREDDADRDPNSTSEAFVLDIGGERIRITGQIDRIDVTEIDGRTHFNVIDYKSGKANLKREQIESGEKLQLPIYVEAAQVLVFQGDATPLAAGYWSMSTGFDAKGALAEIRELDRHEQWEDIRTAVRRAIRQFIDGIRRGEFPVYSRDDDCTSRCDYNTICRISQVRSLAKTWPPATAQ